MARGFSITNVLNKWLDVIRTGGSTYTAPTTVFVKLHTGDPGAAGAGNAAAGTTTRVAVTQATPSAAAMAMNGTSPAWTNGTGGTPTSETITDVSVWDALTGGNFLYSVQLTASKAWAAGDTLTLTSLGVSITPAAA